jgi:hypothetical protein
MLRIVIPGCELWDEQKDEFITREEQVLELEHSLFSVAEWESKWNKAFLSKKEKTQEESMDYIRCMTLNPVDPEIYDSLSRKNIDDISKYINAQMTASIVHDNASKNGGRGTVTAEVIYDWMISLNIPIEFQHWHLNRLITQIRVSSLKNAPSKKTSQRELASRYAAMNAANRKRFNSKG